MGRYVRGLLIGLLLCISSTDYALAAPKHATRVNRTVPRVTPPTPLSFSADPTDAEFLRTGLFADPLAPVNETTALENRDLAQAVLAYRDAVRRSGANDAVEPLLTFLDAHPDSPWKPALQLNLGIVYRQTGHFSKALSIWQAAWKETRESSDTRSVALANAIVARLSQLEAYLGRKELLQPLLDEIDARPVGGTAAQLITDSHTGLYEMLHQPEESFRCGPLALKRILSYGDEGAQVSQVSLRALDEAKSTPNGLSLTAVREVSERAGMNYQMAFRAPGSAIVMPAVAHWKVGHYAAIVDKIDGRYVVQDTTFGEDIRISPDTLDEEASGYFLVPSGELPKGWRSVSADEGKGIWGRGNTGSNQDSGAPGCGGCGSGGGGESTGGGVGGGSGSAGGYTTPDVELEVVGLQLHDAPLGYTPPVGPRVTFALYYSHRDTQQPTTFAYTNFGRKWTFNWLSYITDRVSTNSSAVFYRRGGGNEPFTFSSGTATTSYTGPYSQTGLTRTVNGSGATTGFTLKQPDGTFQQFNQALGNQWFLTAIGDAAGNKVTLTYDSQMRIVAITDAIGQVSTLTYGLAGKPLVVTQITDPFGRTATFTYNSSGQLASITDSIGITSSYTYGQGADPDFINTLTTPYGSTTFTYGDSSTNASLGATRFLRTVDPLNRTSYVEYAQSIDPVDATNGVLKNPALLPVGLNTCNQYLYYRNTFVFDPHQYALATQGGGLDHNQARVIHWLHTGDQGSASRVRESEKQPLENRIWYNYANQPTGSCGSIFFPVTIGGVVTSGASNLPTAIAQVLDDGNTKLETFQYNASGKVTQYVDSMGRKTTHTYAANGVDRLTTSNTTNGTQLLETLTYNSQHRPLTVTAANGMTSRYQYNAVGQVTRYTDPLGRVTTYTYDPRGHLKTIQKPFAGARYSLAFDNASRVAAVTDAVGSIVRYSYDDADRTVGVTYPDGTTSSTTYNLLDVASSTDRLGRTTSYTYDAARQLKTVTDPLNHSVNLSYNLAGVLNEIRDENNHVTTFTLDTQSRVTTKQYADGTSVSLAYDGLSRVVALTDALGQMTNFAYNADNTTASIQYSATQPTPGVFFSYDPAYYRLTGMSDGNGNTTYDYYPVSSSPVLGATQLRSITTQATATGSTDTVQYEYDAMNRVVRYTVNGAVESVGLDALDRVTSVTSPLDSFAYSYTDATQRVTGISSAHGPTFSLNYFGPTADELLQQITATANGGGAVLAQYSYTHDADGNVASFTSALPTTQTTSYTYDLANRLKSALTGAGPTPQFAYDYDAASNLTSITANGSTQSLTYNSTNAITAGTYDLNGSPTSLGGKTYTWDGANRLVGFSDGANNSSTFSYDGLGRLVRIVDTSNGVVAADHSYFWCGWSRCLARDNLQSGSPVSAQYFSQGVISGGVPYYYVEDRLGSVRQLVTAGGTVAVQYDYEPYGARTTTSGSATSDVGYAGYFHHALSGLDFSLYRAYDPMRGRWLNRDPIGEAGGINVYSYAGLNPILYSDSTGLFLDTSGLYTGARVNPAVGEVTTVAA